MNTVQIKGLIRLPLPPKSKEVKIRLRFLNKLISEMSLKILRNSFNDTQKASHRLKTWETELIRKCFIEQIDSGSKI